MTRAALILAAALLAPLPAAAQTAPAASSAADARYQKAMTFLKLLNSPERVKAQVRDGYFEGFTETVAAHPEAKALEEQFPGIFQEIAEATFPYVEKLVLDALPELWRLQATLLSQRMTDAELADCANYFTSPAGLRTVDALVGAFTGENAIANVTSDNPVISAEGLKQDIVAAAPLAYDRLSASDKAAILAFSRSPGGRKLASLNGDMLQLMTDWTNRVLANSGIEEEVKRVAEPIFARRSKARQ